MLKLIRVIVVLSVLSGLAWYTWQDSSSKTSQKVFTGWLEGEQYRVVAEVGGKVTQLLVQEGQQIDKDEAVAQLDDATAKIQLAQALANFSAAQAKSGDIKAGTRPQQISQAKAQVKALQSSLAGAQETLKRAIQQRQNLQELASQGGATADQLDAANTAVATAQASVDSLRSQVQAAQEQVRLLEEGATGYTVSATTAQAEASRQQVELARLQVNKARLTSAVKARVQQIVLKSGELANPGATVVKLIDDINMFVTIYIPQSQLGLVKVGQKVKVQGENSNDVQTGEITFISSQGEFTPKNIQTQEERATQVFAVKVAVTSTKNGGFRPGQAVEVHLD